MTNDYNILVIDVANAVNSPLFGEESNATKYEPTLGVNSTAARALFLLGERGFTSTLPNKETIPPNPYSAVLVDPEVAYNNKIENELVKNLLEEIRAQHIPVIAYSAKSLATVEGHYGYKYDEHFDAYISKDDDSTPNQSVEDSDSFPIPKTTRDLKKLESTLDALIASSKVIQL